MKNSFYLAFQYLRFYKLRTSLLIISLALIIFLPNGLKRLISDSENQLMDRAIDTPLIIGSKGSSSDLVLNTLYFQQEKIDQMKLSDISSVNMDDLGNAIPILCTFNARGYPIVGTDLDYFHFRNLNLSSGRAFGFLGECVLGAKVSEELNLKEGDYIVSSPENFFNLAGVYPLKMKITGVLAESYSPDDKAIFTDLKTTWVIAGYGHGHEDLAQVEDPTLILSSNDSVKVASAKLRMYQEINEENRSDIHFHGSLDEFPLSSYLFYPNDDKSSTLIRGRFETEDLNIQINIPSNIIQNLLGRIFKIRELFDLMFILVGAATFLIFLLITLLSLRLRESEIETLYILGSSRLKLVQMLSFEILIVLGLSAMIASGLYFITGFFVESFIQKFILS